MKYVIQLINNSNGVRSKEFMCTRDELKIAFENADEIDTGDFVLIIGSYTDEEGMNFVNVPLFTIGSFMETFAITEDQIDFVDEENYRNDPQLKAN